MIINIDKQIGHNRQAMSQGIGHDGHAEMLALLRRILAQHLVAPQLPQLRLARRRRVGIDIGRVEGRELILNALQKHGAAIFGSGADGGIEFVRLLLGFSRLAQNSLGEKHFASQLREHGQDVRVVFFEQTVQFCGKRIHDSSTGDVFND